MAAYLIDYENVKSEGIRGILQLCEQDSVIIFYSHNADTLTFETMDMIFGSKATVRKYKIVRGGKNALDFQLSTYLGYLIHEGKDSCFYIISKDNGFQHVVEFWKRTFNYDGYVYCFPTIADAYAKHRRFELTSAKEREKAIEEDMLALQEIVPEDEPTPTVSEVPDEESIPQETVVLPETELEADINETDETEDTVTAEEEYITDEEMSEPLITITSHEDNFIIETIHEEAAVTPDEPSSAQNPAEIPVFSASLAEKIAAAVPDSWLKVTVVENNVTVHQVPEESETVPQTAEPKNETAAAAAETTVKTAEHAVAETEEVIAAKNVVLPVPETVVSETSAEISAEAPTEHPAPASKKKPRQASKKKQNVPTGEEKVTEPEREAKEITAEPESVAEPTVETREEANADEVKPARRRQSHHGGRRKKTPAAPVAVAETEAAPAAAPDEKEPERKPHRTHNGSSRGRRPKSQKSEAAAFTE